MEKDELAILIETHTLVKTLHAKVLGNGQPGLLADVAEQGARIGALERAVPSPAEKRLLKGSRVLSIITVAAALVAKLFGIPLPG